MKQWITALFQPVASVLNKRQERKMAKESAKGKLALAKQEGQFNLEMKDSEWEVIGQQLQGGTWKDEYITVSIVSVFNLIIAGGILAAFGDDRLLTGIGFAMQAMTQAGVDVGTLLTAVVFAGIGLKFWRA